MCGMAGYIDWKSSKGENTETIERMVGTLTHRGPDGTGVWADEVCSLGHTRLSIIDLQHGGQPMSIQGKAAKPLVITYNGELYNYHELRIELQSLGEHFTTNSDTEVILRAYNQWDTDCVTHFVGMFAFAIWDVAKQRLFMARDPLGVKPLYYYQTPHGMMFGSEEKSILAHPDVPAELDQAGIAELFCMVPMTNPTSSILKGIVQVRPGHTVTVTKNATTNHCYWRLEAIAHTDNEAATVKKVRALFENSTRSQMVSDVPIGALLSGGVDSSAVAALVAQISKDEGVHIPTFAIDYTSEETSYAASALHVDRDTPWAEKVAKHINSKHTTHYVSVDDLLEAQAKTLHAWGRPSYSPVNVSLYLLFRHIRESGVYTVLGGEGADEAFAGYRWWRDAEDVAYDGFPWHRTYRAADYLLHDGIRSAIQPDQYRRDRYLESLEQVPTLPGENKHEHRMRVITWMTYTYYLNFLLHRVDRMSMAASVEARVPFCDHNFVQYCWNIPWEMKNVGDIEKGILRQAIEHLLPKEVAWRRKSGYPVAQMAAYQKVLWENAHKLLKDNGAPVWEIVSKKAVKALIDDQAGNIGEWTALNHISYILEMDAWLKEFHIRLC